jgi:hypothetical protein
VRGYTEAQRRIQTMTSDGSDASSRTCPKCGMTSYNPDDIREGYCGNCHDWVILPPTVKQFGDPRKDATWQLLPAEPGVCWQCARDHEPELPHDAQSLHYKYTFYAEHDRWPTWEDAMAHCAADVQEAWCNALREHGVDLS